MKPFYIIKSNCDSAINQLPTPRSKELNNAMFSTFEEAQSQLYDYIQEIIKREDPKKIRVQWFGNGFYLRSLKVDPASPLSCYSGSFEIHRITPVPRGQFKEAEAYQEWQSSQHPFNYNNYLDVPMAVYDYDQEENLNEEQIKEQFDQNYNETLIDALERHAAINNLSELAAYEEYALTQPYNFYFKNDQLWLRILAGGQFSQQDKSPNEIKDEIVGQLEDGWLENGAEITNFCCLFPAEDIADKAHWAQNN